MRLFPDLNVRALWTPQSITQLDSEMDSLVAGQPTFTGVNVSENLAMNFPGFYACNKVLSETMTSTPCQLKQRLEKGGARDAEEHALYRVVNKEANVEVSSADFWGSTMVHNGHYGNSYSFIDMATRGRNAGSINGLVYMHPGRTKPFRDASGRLKYEYRKRLPNGGLSDPITYDYTQILHIPGFSFDGLIGYSPVACARQAIGLGLALEEFQGRFFSNGAHVRGLLLAPDVKDDAAKTRLRESVKESVAGLSKAFGIMVVTGAQTFEPITMPLDDAELLASRKFTLEEMARIFRIPLHLIQNLERATFSNIEHQSLEFVMFTWTPWVRRYEQRMDMRLLTEAEKRQGYFVKFNVRGLMRGDMKAQGEFFKIMKEVGGYNANRILQLLDENPRTDPGGEKFWDEGPSGQGKSQTTEKKQARLKNAILALLGAGDDADGAVDEIQAQGGKEAIRTALEPVLADCMNRIERRQEDIIEEAGRRAKKGDAEGMKAWLNGFYQRHKADAESILSSYFKALNEPERAPKEAETVVESLRMGLEAVDIMDPKAVTVAIKGADAA
jgi:HK97 family phage portal protein